MGIIEIKNLKIWSNTGWYREELLVANEFSISVKMHLRLDASVSHLSSTVDYAEVTRLIKEVFQQAPPLLEQINEQIARNVLKAFQVVERMSVKVEKKHPSIGADVESVSYTRIWVQQHK